MFGRLTVSRLLSGTRQFSTTRAARDAVRAAMVVQRDPIVIQQATGFEAAADQYFQWLEYRSAEKFPRDFYFKPGSSAERNWAALEEQRAAEWYFDMASKPAEKREEKVKQPEGEEEEDEQLGRERSTQQQTVAVQPRTTKADAADDLQSLERRLDRTLYLVVRNSAGQWEFPQGTVQSDELLAQAARRSLRDACGSGMSVWTVGKGPIGHKDSLFFVKAHILSGQAAKAQAADFKWVTREELETVVAADYWATVKDLLSTV
ncbi:hypothetical protein LPJ63_001994 [Coemansia sp. RSA 2711]|nr:hypothetical protein LPJ63_001994 [Coemansia sp. RSA 2711]KAJ2329525.1 hypothetical protein IWW51_000552 [Coemansia sp. RSA 2702]